SLIPFPQCLRSGTQCTGGGGVSGSGSGASSGGVSPGSRISSGSFKGGRSISRPGSVPGGVVGGGFGSGSCPGGSGTCMRSSSECVMVFSRRGGRPDRASAVPPALEGMAHDMGVAFAAGDATLGPACVVSVHYQRVLIMQAAAVHLVQRHQPTEAWRIHAPFSSSHTPASSGGHDQRDWASACRDAAAAGFNGIWIPHEWLGAPDPRSADLNGGHPCVAACVEHHLRLAVDIDASATRQESWVTLLTSTLQALPQALPVIVVLRGLTHEPFEAWEALLARLRESRDELEISIW